MKFLRYTVLVILIGLSTVWADLSSELRAETEKGLCGDTPSAIEWKNFHTYEVMFKLKDACSWNQYLRGACLQSTRPLKNICSITAWDDVNFTLRLDRENTYLHYSVWHHANGNIKCLITSNYEWECLYLSGNFTYSSGSTGSQAMPFNIQEQYLSFAKKYVDANLAN
jgi:hypothetical protein